VPKIEIALIPILLLLRATPSLADVTTELARCQLEAARLFPAPPKRGAQNWADRAANLQKQAENVETCMRRAGYKVPLRRPCRTCCVAAPNRPACDAGRFRCGHCPTSNQSQVRLVSVSWEK
jgi:hypothetical protein